MLRIFEIDERTCGVDGADIFGPSPNLSRTRERDSEFAESEGGRILDGCALLLLK
jgi:hypothetical protein